MNEIKSIITNDKVKGLLAVIAAIVMFYTPDYVDRIIEALLAAFGIEKLIITKEE